MTLSSITWVWSFGLIKMTLYHPSQLLNYRPPKKNAPYNFQPKKELLVLVDMFLSTSSISLWMSVVGAFALRCLGTAASQKDAIV